VFFNEHKLVGGHMKSTLTIVAFALCSCATLAWGGRQHHPWLSIVKSTDGFLFEGRLERTEFSFDIPGDRIQVGRQEEPGDPATMAIDDLYFSVVSVSTSDFAPTGPDILGSYREYEQQYERENLDHVVLSDLDVCEGASLQHVSWQMEAPAVKVPAQTFMAVVAGDYVVVVGSAFENDEQKEQMLGKFAGLCESFEINKAK
jgi:hypothetical protein